jgi:hypothetical protein
LLLEHELTADEVAEALGRSPFSIRPRISELKASGHLVDTGKTRLNNTWSGVEGAGWKAV